MHIPKKTKDSYGLTTDGTMVKFYYGVIYASDKNLKEIYIDEGVVAVYCIQNHLKTIKVPKSLTELWCDHGLFDYDKCKIPHVRIYYPNSVG